MLGSDQLLTAPLRFCEGSLNNAFCTRRHIGSRDLAGNSRTRQTNNGVFHLFGIHTAALQIVCGNTAFLAAKTEQKVLRANVGVTHLRGT